MPEDRRKLVDRSRRDDGKRETDRLGERDRKRLRRSRSRSVEKPRSPGENRKRRRSVTPKRDETKRVDRKRTAREESRSRSREKRDRERKTAPKSSKVEIDEPSVFASPDFDDIDDPDSVAQIMGFTSFDTTKGKKVAGNDVGMASVALKRKYRQYMNRRGGFNRPLDAVS